MNDEANTSTPTAFVIRPPWFLFLLHASPPFIVPLTASWEGRARDAYTSTPPPPSRSLGAPRRTAALHGVSDIETPNSGSPLPPLAGRSRPMTRRQRRLKPNGFFRRAAGGEEVVVRRPRKTLAHFCRFFTRGLLSKLAPEVFRCLRRGQQPSLSSRRLPRNAWRR